MLIQIMFTQLTLMIKGAWRNYNLKQLIFNKDDSWASNKATMQSNNLFI